MFECFCFMVIHIWMSINEFIFDVMLMMSLASCEVSASVDDASAGKTNNNTRCPPQVTSFDVTSILIVIVKSILTQSGRNIPVPSWLLKPTAHVVQSLSFSESPANPKQNRTATHFDMYVLHFPLQMYGGPSS